MIGFGYRSYLPLKLGRVVATTGAVAALAEANSPAMQFLVRHSAGDWGDVAKEDSTLNNQALKDGARILSAYTLRDGETRIWIITEADRSVTTILLPSDY